MLLTSTPRFVYERSLPAGGFVGVTVTEARSLRRSRAFEGTVVVERRSASRRSGHAPPVGAQAWSKTADDVIRHLLPIAQCTPMLGAALLRLRVTSGTPNMAQR